MQSLREAISNQRIACCRPINEDPEPRMRHCESCEVPVGILSLKAFDQLCTCTICGKPVHCELTKQKLSVSWITAEVAEIRYRFRRGTIYKLINNGILTSKKADRGRLILESEIAAMRAKRPLHERGI